MIFLVKWIMYDSNRSTFRTALKRIRHMLGTTYVIYLHNKHTAVPLMSRSGSCFFGWTHVWCTQIRMSYFDNTDCVWCVVVSFILCDTCVRHECVWIELLSEIREVKVWPTRVKFEYWYAKFITRILDTIFNFLLYVINNNFGRFVSVQISFRWINHMWRSRENVNWMVRLANKVHINEASTEKKLGRQIFTQWSLQIHRPKCRSKCQIWILMFLHRQWPHLLRHQCGLPGTVGVTETIITITVVLVSPDNRIFDHLWILLEVLVDCLWHKMISMASDYGRV